MMLNVLLVAQSASCDALSNTCVKLRKRDICFAGVGDVLPTLDYLVEYLVSCASDMTENCVSFDAIKFSACYRCYTFFFFSSLLRYKIQ